MTKSETRKLDKIFKEKLFENAGYMCEITGQNQNECQLHPHHYIGRRYKSLRWWIPNGICLSAAKHTMSIWSAHQNPEWFRKEMIDRRGQKWIDDLHKRSNLVFKGKFEAVKEYLEGKRKDYL